jgi:hypothetical protein
MLDLKEVVFDIADALVRIDGSGEPFRAFQAGVGPYGEPQLIRRIATQFNELPKYRGTVRTKRTPDLLIPNKWAIEFKITRPYGDNGKEAENWSVNHLHPYPGSVSTVGDSYKLADLQVPERRAIAVIGYEHAPAKIDLTPLIESFEAIAKHVAHIRLSSRVEARRENLVHPVHQSLRIFAWEVLERRGRDDLIV